MLRSIRTCSLLLFVLKHGITMYSRVWLYEHIGLNKTVENFDALFIKQTNSGIPLLAIFATNYQFVSRNILRWSKIKPCSTIQWNITVTFDVMKKITRAFFNLALEIKLTNDQITTFNETLTDEIQRVSSLIATQDRLSARKKIQNFEIDVKRFSGFTQLIRILW